jgi:hypothetical protein
VIAEGGIADLGRDDRDDEIARDAVSDEAMLRK